MAFRNYANEMPVPRRGFRPPVEEIEEESVRAPMSYAPPTSAPSRPDAMTLGTEGIADLKRRQDQDKLDQSNREKEIVRRVIFGDAGERPGQGYDERLLEELKNPAEPMTEAETKLRADPFAVEKTKAKSTLAALLKPREATDKNHPKSDYTDQILAYANTFKPGMEIQVGVDANKQPIMERVTVDAVKRMAMKRSMKFNPNDPRWGDLEAKWAAAPGNSRPGSSAGPGFMDKVLNLGRSAMGKMTPTASPGGQEFPDFAPDEVNEADEIMAEFPDATQLQDGRWVVMGEDGEFQEIRRQ